MNLLPFAIVAITLALLFYTVGVWSERLQKTLRVWHIVLFWIGFVFDTTGTTLMGMIAPDGFQLNFHGITGLLAIVLMALHAIWATVTRVGGREDRLRSFHRFSLAVWAVWLVPYLSGMVVGMMR
jgi:uncharacterized repeat protein (TIGR03987 family)